MTHLELLEVLGNVLGVWVVAWLVVAAANG